jgi:rhamnose transport system permease protein
MDLTALARRREVVLLVLIALLLAAVGARAPVFLTPASLGDVLTDTAILLMLACGQMAVILTRGIDLSVASNMAFTGMCTALLSKYYPELPIAVTLALAPLIGFCLGAVNGALIAWVKIPPIVVTLGTLSAYRGMIFILSGGASVVTHEFSRPYLDFPRQSLFGVSALVWIALVVCAGMAVFLNFSRTGRSLYAVGGNPLAARYVGIGIERCQFLVYCLSGTIAGLCGYLWVSRYAIAFTEVAFGYELTVIAACVIGGVSVAGGIGSVAGCLLGGLFLGIIGNALPVIQVSPFWQMAISGFVILCAVIVNSRSEARKGKLILRETESSVQAPLQVRPETPS